MTHRYNNVPQLIVHEIVEMLTGKILELIGPNRQSNLICLFVELQTLCRERYTSLAT